MGDGSGAPSIGTAGPMTLNGVNYTPGISYFSKADTRFYEAKFTYAVNPFHTLELAGNRNQRDDRSRRARPSTPAPWRPTPPSTTTRRSPTGASSATA